MKRKISEDGDFDIDESIKKLKLNDNQISNKSTQTEFKVYTDIEVQQIIRKLQSIDSASIDNFGQNNPLQTGF